MAIKKLLNPTPSFAGHQTFAVRSGWLKKGIDALQTTEGGATETFSRDDALVTLGVGKNMVQSIRHWLLTMRLAEDFTVGSAHHLRPTDLGLQIFGTPNGHGLDPFLEDPATLWLLHWLICGPGSPAFAWVWAFNVFHEFEFTKETLTDALQAAIQGQVAKAASRETIERDVQCLLNTYTRAKTVKQADDDLECPLRSIGLIRDIGERRFQFQMGPKVSLPTAIFTYALIDFWSWREASSTLSVWDITYAEGSPGAVFRLDEDSVLEYLDDLGKLTNGAFSFQDDLNERAVLKNTTTVGISSAILEDYYNDER